MEYNKFEEAIARAAFSMNAVEVKRLMADSPISSRLFGDRDFDEFNFFNFNVQTYPICFIPQLWEICLRDAKLWDGEAHDRVAAATKANAEIKRMFVATATEVNAERKRIYLKCFGGERISLKDYEGGRYNYLNFNQSRVGFYPKKDIWNDILDRPRQQLIDEGVRELDIDLFEAVHEYSFVVVDRLLRLGANPNREINRDPRDKTCLACIEEGLSFNKSHIIDYVLNYGSRSADDFQMDDLIYLYGWAACERMRTLVNSYTEAKYMSEKVAETYNESKDAGKLYALCCNDMHYCSVREGRSCTSRDEFIAYLQNQFEQGKYRAKVVEKTTDGSTFVKLRRRCDESDTFILRVMPAKDKIDGIVKIGAITMEEYSPSLETDNPFSLKGMEFGDYVWKMDFGCFDDLMPLMEPLDCLSIRQGYVLDAFRCGNDMGSRSQLYCRKERSEIMYLEPKEDEWQTRKGRLQFRLDEDKELPPYTDDMYLQGMYRGAVSDLIPEIWPYITAEFSAMAVWQCYLLHIASSSFLPLGWHAIYGERNNIFVPSNLKGLKVDCSEYYDDPLVFPSVELTGDNEAIVSCCYWNDWQGLIRETVKVTFVDGHAQFGESVLITLVPYESDVCF